MPNKPLITEEGDTRQRILDAAMARFARYGFGKTTMAELATDLDMSAANLYRFFESKHDIGAACANRCMSDRLSTLREAVRQPGLNAGARLRAYVLGTLQFTREMSKNQPHVNELVENVTLRRKDIVHEKIRNATQLIAEVLANGNATGEFDIADVHQTALTVYATLPLFEVPLFINLMSEAEFDALANQVTDLLLKGLQRR